MPYLFSVNVYASGDDSLAVCTVDTVELSAVYFKDKNAALALGKLVGFHVGELVQGTDTPSEVDEIEDKHGA